MSILKVFAVFPLNDVIVDYIIIIVLCNNVQSLVL